MTTKTNTKTLITIKTDKLLKKAVQEKAHELGIPLGTLINMKLRQFLREKEVSFVSGYTPNAKTAKILKQSEKEFERGEFDGPFTLKELAKEWKLIKPLFSCRLYTQNCLRKIDRNFQNNYR